MSKREHNCPSCVCGRDHYYWSDREVYCRPDDIERLAEIVVNCALDHSYDRAKDGVPWGFAEEKRAKLIPIVNLHLSKIRLDWADHTMEMDESQKEAFLSDIREALKE